MGTVYAMTLDDADVCQMLPVRGDQFDQGVSIYIWCSGVFVEVVLLLIDVRSFVGTDYSYGPAMVPRQNHVPHPPTITHRLLHSLHQIRHPPLPHQELQPPFPWSVLLRGPLRPFSLAPNTFQVITRA